MSSRSSSSSEGGLLWSLTTRDVVRLVLLADLAMLGKALVRIPIHVPGHSGLVWVAIFIVARGMVDKRGAGLVLGFVSGVVAIVFGFGDSGLLEGLNYVAAGALLELVAITVPGRLDNPAKAALAGAATHVGKLAAMFLVAMALRIPLGFAVLGLGYRMTTHLVFGVLGGLLGALVLHQLRRVPGLVPGPEDEVISGPSGSSRQEDVAPANTGGRQEEPA
jgi:hypothetical protein